MMEHVYYYSFLGVAFILATVVVQHLVATVMKSKEQGAVPGTVPKDMTPANTTFRVWRTHQNSLENLTVMLGTVFLSVTIGVSPMVVAVLVWIFAVGRFMHMILYYFTAPKGNPSSRSWFFLAALFANVALLAACIDIMV